MKHSFGPNATHTKFRTFRVNANLVWTLGLDPTVEEARDISAIVSTTGPHTVTFRCRCCDRPIGVIGRDMGVGPEWLQAVTVWENLRSGETLRPKA